MKNKNRLSASILCLLMVVFCSAVLTACDMTEFFCVHEWGEYTVIENATCSKEGVQERKCLKCEEVETSVIEKTAHIASGDDGDCTTHITCFLCGGVAVEAQASHVGGTATCNALAKCILCGKEYGSLAAHVPAADDGDCTTAVNCSVCGLVAVEAQTRHVIGADDGDCTTPVTCVNCDAVMITARLNHTGGVATCTSKAKCTTCNKEYGNFAEHILIGDDGDCTTAETCRVCGIDVVLANKTHQGGKATCLTPAQCEICGTFYGELEKHIPNADDGDCTTAVCCSICGTVTEPAHVAHAPNLDDGDCTTAITCSICDTVLTPAAKSHTGGVATCKQKATCVICNTEYGSFADHVPFADDGDCTTAIHCSVCGVETTVARRDHTGGKATCEELARCEICNIAYGSLADHIPNADDGNCATPITCSVCGTVTTEANTHTGGTATCNALAKCTVCGEEYGEFADHIPNADDGDCTTAITCSVCSSVITEANEAHVAHPDDNNCMTAVTCMYCDTVMTAAQEAHIAGEDDGNCTTAITCINCSVVITEAREEHTGGTATCEELARCEICNTTYGSLAEHIPNADDGDCTTAITCSVCGAVTTNGQETHTGGTATCKELAKCEICNTAYGEYAAHTPNKDDGDCTTPITCSVCSTVTTEASAGHSAETTWIKHLDSHYLVYNCCVVRASEPEAHNMVDGACTECGFNPSITVTSTEVSPGEKNVSISISITDNPGITGFMLSLQYNPDIFMLTKAESGEAFDALAFTAPSELTGGCTFLWDGLEIDDSDIKDGEILHLTFDVSPTAFAGDYLMLLKISAYDNALHPFTLILRGGNITIVNS